MKPSEWISNSDNIETLEMKGYFVRKGMIKLKELDKRFIDKEELIKLLMKKRDKYNFGKYDCYNEIIKIIKGDKNE